ncbi:hypothetical protein OU995_17485 [Roseateles sp. SL47]|uniref:hypothetical protein n=1 Tax=Roseateles sp. SL47 TaxID=2995138 RepID=UPI00226F2D1D|nr:hypothetical protein [Roseateles sp. SL47]WAC71371.1 hypothetical protein OU995_17485 [Roseateles sp. SL47]
MPETSHTFGPSGQQRPSLWRTLLWWVLAALAAFVLLEAVPARAASTSAAMLPSMSGPTPVASGSAVGPAAVPRLTAGLPLPVITPIADCSALTSTSLVEFAGAGRRGTKAFKATSQGLPASIQFRVELPLGRWTQPYL